MSKRCEICSLNFIDEYAMHGHLMGKKHLKNVELEKERTQKEQNSIFVSPLPARATADAIINLFSTYGDIQYYRFGPRYVIIEYNKREPADFLLKTPIFLDKYKLSIRRRRIDNNQKHKEKRNISSKSSFDETKLSDTNNKNNKDDELIELVRLELEEESTFDGQLEKLLQLIQLDDNEVQIRCDKVCESLNRVLKTTFKQCQAIRFGSTVTGLNLKESDMDVFLEIGDTVREVKESKTGNAKHKPYDGWTSDLVFKEVKYILYKNKSIFTRIIPIPLAKIPVIKFHHLPTNTDCDVSFKNSLGVHNSKLIKHLLSLDPRIKPFMIIIKYWAKRMDLTGTGKITNYSLVIAMIFYLQQPNLQILPTIRDIQTGEPIFLCGWNINFNKDIRPKNSSESSIPQLLYGFFKFYADFNFNTTIICPLDGSMYQKIIYPKVAEDWGVNVEYLHLNRPVCIQDPIKLDHNIASGWSERLLRDFQLYCNAAVGSCEYAAKDNYKDLLLSLYDSCTKKRSTKVKKYQIVIPAGRFEKIEHPNDFDYMKDDQNIKNNWFLTIYKLVEEIFEKIFKYEVQVIYNMINMKQLKTEKTSDVYSKRNEKVIVLCKGNYCLNRGRNNYPHNLDLNLSPIEREMLISDKVLAALKYKKEESSLKFTCTLEKSVNPLIVKLTLSDAQYTNKAFTEIATFMRSKIPIIIDKQLVYMLQYNKSIDDHTSEKINEKSEEVEID